jgi:hypothetical protein
MAASRLPRGGQAAAVAARPLTDGVMAAEGDMTAAMRREKLKRLEQSLFGYSATDVSQIILHSK